jgi:hypothetical protein
LEAPKHHKAINQQVSRYQSHKSRSRDTREPKTQGPSSKGEGKSNRFGEDVDQGLFLRFSKDQELWWVEGGDLVDLVAPNGVFFLCRTSSLRWKKGRGIYSPSQRRGRAADLEGQIIRPKYGRIIRPLDRKIWPLYWMTSTQVLSRILRSSKGGGLSGPWPKYPAPLLHDADQSP